MSWERRLLACCRRQLADDHQSKNVSASRRNWQAGSLRSPERLFRRDAETTRDACASQNYASARLGSISSANLETIPFSNRNIAANAIMAALSVHNQGSATRNSIPFFSQAARKSSRNARLQLTPPLNVRHRDLVCRSAQKLFSRRTSMTAC